MHMCSIDMGSSVKESTHCVHVVGQEIATEAASPLHWVNMHFTVVCFVYPHCSDTVNMSPLSTANVVHVHCRLNRTGHSNSNGYCLFVLDYTVHYFTPPPLYLSKQGLLVGVSWTLSSSSTSQPTHQPTLLTRCLQ